MKLLLIFALAMVLYPLSAKSQQLNEQGCAYAADVAITARALSAAGVERGLAEKIMRSMYTSPQEFAQKLRERITDLAYQSDKAPREYSQFIYGACYAARGQVEKFLGIGV